jgi:CO/xanthine dehydrogenase FAD-binding subunit
MRFLKEPGMRLPKFEYMDPRSLKEASKTLALDPKGSVLLAGGTDTAEKGNLGV